jgi:hypothetical protein
MPLFLQKFTLSRQFAQDNVRFARCWLRVVLAIAWREWFLLWVLGGGLEGANACASDGFFLEKISALRRKL